MIGRQENVVPLRARQGPVIEPFRPFYASQMEGREPKAREWLVDGVMVRRSVVLSAGAPKIGKSLLAQQMLTAIATGETWLDRATLRAKCFGFFCEDPQEELERRQADINVYYDKAAADLELDFSWISRDGDDAILVEFERDNKMKLTPLWHQMVNYIRDEGVQVLLLDTAATVFGGNENFRSQTTAFLRELQKLAIEMDGAVVINAHPSRSSPNSHSGSTAWLASVRSGFSLGRPADWDEEQHGRNDPRRVLRGLGSNYGGGIGAESLEYRDGVFVCAEQMGSPRKKAGPLNHTERADAKYRLLIGLKRVMQNGGLVPADEMQRGSLPARVRRSPDPQINRISLNDLYSLQAELIDGGQLVRVEVGGRIMIRPAEGPYYPDEQPWVPAPAPKVLSNA